MHDTLRSKRISELAGILKAALGNGTDADANIRALSELILLAERAENTLLKLLENIARVVIESGADDPQVAALSSETRNVDVFENTSPFPKEIVYGGGLAAGKTEAIKGIAQIRQNNAIRTFENVTQIGGYFDPSHRDQSYLEEQARSLGLAVLKGGKCTGPCDGFCSAEECKK